jgi:peptidoglycan hydrolase-like protein with peptidoglycan-binding domain
MQKRKLVFAAVMAFVVFACVYIGQAPAFASSTVLKNGMRGDAVTKLQKDLKTLGYFSVDVTGYYGDLTESAVKKLQKAYKYSQDGIAGKATFSLINELLGQETGSSSRGSASTGSVLKFGMRGDSVYTLQKNLKNLGYMTVAPTGYYGELTEAAVKKLQKQHGCTVDGIAGRNTFSLIDKLIGEKGSAASRGKPDSDGYMMPWFGKAENFFKIGKTAEVIDIETGLSFEIKRTYGYNHADCETLTADDTKIMKEIYGGEWSWNRRAVIVTVDGVNIAASMAGMPHAGLDRYAKNKRISSRSGGYGAGSNLDAVKDNNMDGVFDLHFYKSKTHGTNRVDENHQKAVKKAAEWAENNL